MRKTARDAREGGASADPATPPPTAGQARASGGTPAAAPNELGTSSPAPPQDLVLVGDRIPESGGYRVLRQREDRLEVGEMRALKQGQPLTGEIVRLEPTATHERVFACETLHDTDAAASQRARSAGPAQVATAAYRKNWEQIFGSLAAQLDAARGNDADASAAIPSAPPDRNDLN